MKASVASPRKRTRQSGFTLIELMVGAVLGMLTVIVIAQVLAESEGRRRTVATGSDAEVNGSLSLFSLQRDIQVSGYGIASNQAALGCTVQAKYDTSSAFNFALAPVVITNGTSDAPDSISILFGSSQSSSVPLKVTEDHPQTQDYFIVESGLGVRQGDQLIVVPATIDSTHQCTLLSATNDTTASDTTLGLTRIPHTSASKWNQPTIFPSDGYVANSYLLNLGSLTQRTYSISSSYTLQTEVRASSNGATSTTDLYPNVVNLQALYGKDTDNNGSVDRFDHETPATAAEWKQVLSIKLAIVTRSTQYEQKEVTTTDPLWDIGGTITPTGETTETCHGTSTCIALKVSTLSDWKHYRYKVYSTTVPLRNMLWNS